jgi:hypothetical protein
MADNQVNVLVPNQQYRNQIETYQIGNPTSLPLLVEALRQYVLSLPVEPDKGLAEKVATLESKMATVEENITTLEQSTGVLETDVSELQEGVGNVNNLATKSKTLVPAINETFNLASRTKAVWQERTASTDFFIHPSVPRILLGVYTGDGGVSYYNLDWNSVTSSPTQLTEIKLGSVNITVQATLMSTGRYKINVSSNPSQSRGVALVMFDQGYIE